MAKNNAYEQATEQQILRAIYGPSWEFEDQTGTYSIDVQENIKLYVTLNPDYPSRKPPSYDLLAPVLSRSVKERIHQELATIYQQNYGGPILYQWVERLKEIAAEVSPDKGEHVPQRPATTAATGPRNEVVHGRAIVDRKSVFQGHCSKILCTSDISLVMDDLLSSKKIRQAKHNVTAYRIETPDGVIVQGCDDDGEKHSSQRVLYLLEKLKVRNVLVVITRWYGGIQLGNDRFKHYNNAAKAALTQAGLVESG